MVISSKSEGYIYCKTENDKFFKDTSVEIALSEEEIRIYKIHLGNDLSIVEHFKTILSPTEIKRSERYYHQTDKNRFIVTRGVLKKLLSIQTNIPIDKVVFEKTKDKKPYFPLDKSIKFNVSHSGDYAVIAIAKCDVGVDIEKVNDGFNYLEILPSIFNKKEIETIENSQNSTQCFFKLWTRKEAIVKATGKGIDDDLPLIPVIDGRHKIPIALLGGFETMEAVSFQINRNYYGCVAFPSISKDVTVQYIDLQLGKLIYNP